MQRADSECAGSDMEADDRKQLESVAFSDAILLTAAQAADNVHLHPSPSPSKAHQPTQQYTPGGTTVDETHQCFTPMHPPSKLNPISSVRLSSSSVHRPSPLARRRSSLTSELNCYSPGGTAPGMEPYTPFEGSR